MMHNLNTSNRKVVLFANSDWFNYNFNVDYAIFLEENSFECTLICPPGPYFDRIKGRGLNVMSTPHFRSSINPLSYIFVLFWLCKFLKKYKPDVIHNYTLICIILGTIAATISGVSKVVNEITGLGYLFISKTFKAGFIRSIIIFIIRTFSKATTTYLTLNKYDYLKIKRMLYGITNEVYLVNGSGVDCTKFQPRTKSKSNKTRILLPARMLYDKGVVEFVDASISLSHLRNKIEFLLAGPCDQGNPSSISSELIAQWQADGSVTWLGFIERMDLLYNDVDIVVLPSYREGLPTSLIEAAASGLPIITTNVPGCIDVVNNLFNGIIVPVKSSSSISDAICFLLKNPEIAKEFGENSRKLALSKFEKSVVNTKRMSFYS